MAEANPGQPDKDGGAGEAFGWGRRGPRGSRGDSGRQFGLRDVLLYSCVFAGLIYTYFSVHSQGDKTQKVAVQTQNLVLQIEREGVDRRNDTCLTFEGQYVQEIRQLIHTYDYLAPLPTKDLGSPLNQAVLKQLPELEVNARRPDDNNGVRVPNYCGKKGVGLDKIPKLPDRPLSLP